MKTLKILPDGTATELEIERKTLTDEFKIHLRDLRPVFSLKQVATLSRRGTGIVVNFRSAKMLIGAKKVYIFNLQSRKIAEHFVPGLVEKIRSAPPSIRFEFVVLEFALAFVLGRIELKFATIERSGEAILKKLKTELRDDDLERLLVVKKQLLGLQTTIREFDELMNELLDDDAELADLYLSGRKPANTDEIESIIENSLEQIENFSHRVDELSENIDDTQEILTLKMSSLRNVIIKFDLVISSVAVILALAAVIVGMFGMNVPNFHETDSAAFFSILMILVGIFAIFGVGIFIFLRRRGVV